MWRRKSTKGDKVRLFFATDIHGSERCFRKWLGARRAYDAPVLILGGDIAGKTLVPFEAIDGGWRARLDGGEVFASTETELDELRARVRAGGSYAVTVGPAELALLEADSVLREARFHQAMRDALSEWVALADARLADDSRDSFLMLGNDDPPELADVLRGSATVQYSEDGIFDLPGGYQLLSYGYSTPTPWDTPREQSEEDIAAAIEGLVQQLEDPRRAVFNLHCPPYGTMLDQAPRLDSELRPTGDLAGQAFTSVGSSAVRRAIEQYRPVLGLHGHVHESAAAETIGETLCVNPGSEYFLGGLRGVVVDLGADGSGVTGWQMTHG